MCWDKIERDYINGLSPVEISKKYPQYKKSPKNISDKAYNCNWKSKLIEKNRKEEAKEEVIQQEVFEELKEEIKESKKKELITKEFVLNSLYEIASNQENKINDQTKALELLGKHLGIFEEDNKQKNIVMPQIKIIKDS